jgi:hypothetical protein
MTGYGKTCLAETIVHDMYTQHNNICTPIPDIKGEWYESLLYIPDHSNYSHMKDRLTKYDAYEAGLLREIVQEDTIAIFDFSSYNLVEDLLDMYRMITDYVKDIYKFTNKPVPGVQLNAMFEECALWFPNERSDFKEIFKSYDGMVSKQEKQAKKELEIEKAHEKMYAESGEITRINAEYKIKELEIPVEKIESYIKEIKGIGLVNAIMARSSNCNIGFLAQRAALISTTIVTQANLKFIKRQQDKNDIDRLRATTGELTNELDTLEQNEAIVLSKNHRAVCVLDEPKTYHVSKDPEIRHHGSALEGI